MTTQDTNITKVDFVNNLFRNRCTKLGFDTDTILSELATQPTQSVIIRYVFSLIKRPIQSSRLAGAIAVRDLYLNCPLTVLEYANTFKEFLREDVYDFMVKHHDKLQKIINFDMDFDNLYFSIGTFIATYLSRLDYKSDPKEIPQFCLLRVAVGEFCNRQYTENEEATRLDDIIRMYGRYSRRELIPSSPTIFNMGMKNGAPVACMIYTHMDSMEDILKIIEEAGMASKNNAGLGIDFSLLRHSAIGRHGKSQGVIPLLKIWDDLMNYITQGGRRPGAATGSNRDCHIDIPEFIQMKDPSNEDQVKVNKLNLSIQISDLFMKRVQSKGHWTLFCPKQAPELNNLWGIKFEKAYIECEKLGQKYARYQKYLSFELLNKNGMLRSNKISQYNELKAEFEGQPEPRQIETRIFNAAELYATICDMQPLTGGPYINYYDSINRKNALRHIGPVRSTNLCQEITIPAVPGDQTGSCNLMSTSLKEFVQPKPTEDLKFDFSRFEETVEDGVICLNQVIDNAVNVSDKVKKSNRLSRPIGLGVSGYADMLHRLKMPICDPNKIPIGPDGKPDYSENGLLRRVVNPKVDKLNWFIWSCMYYTALKTSVEEAKRYGACESFKDSPAAQGLLQFHFWHEEEKETGRKYDFRLYPAEPTEWQTDVEYKRIDRYEIGPMWLVLIEDIKTYGLRNLLHLSVQPTASTAQIVANAESTELHSGNIYMRKVLSGDYPVINEYCVSDLENLGLWDKRTYDHITSKEGSILHIPEEWVSIDKIAALREIKELYLTMWEVPQKIMVDLAAQRQVCIDHSQSMNIYIKHPTSKQLQKLH
jgi:ribonucleotide reductase alpha subunit